MNLSAFGLKQIEKREGVIYHVYRDTRGFLTGGCGHLLTPSERLIYPYKSALGQTVIDNWLADDLQKCFHAIGDLVRVRLEQNEFDALVSFIFNIGVKGFAGSTVLRQLNRNNKTAAGRAFLLWNLPPEIKGRRKQESNQFLTPY